jgi:hypothetical protein
VNVHSWQSCLRTSGAVEALLFILALLVLPSHAASLQDQAETAAVADGLTTLGGIALGAAEANPIGLISLVIKAPLLAHVKTLPQDEQAEWHATYGAFWGGAAANNLCIVGAILTSGALAPLCPMVGMAWGMNKWSASAQERELWAICREERAYWKNPQMTCDFAGNLTIETAMTEVLKRSGAPAAAETLPP